MADLHSPGFLDYTIDTAAIGTDSLLFACFEDGFRQILPLEGFDTRFAKSAEKVVPFCCGQKDPSASLATSKRDLSFWEWVHTLQIQASMVMVGRK